MSQSSVAANVVVDCLRNDYKFDLFRGDNGESYISILDSGKMKTFSLKSPQWVDWFIGLLRKNKWRASESRRIEITEELISMASEAKKQSVYVRVANFQPYIYIDLNEESYRAVRIGGSKTDFTIVQPKKVRFVRPAKQQPLQVPEVAKRETFLRDFKTLFPNKPDTWLLVLAFILKCLHRDHGSYAFLIIEGPQGSGKSLLSKRIKMIIDPADPHFFSPPNGPDDILVASLHSYLLVFDNMSGIDHRMADIFCRLSTGGGVSKRKLYFDHEESVYRLHRPCIINGIDEPTNRADFIDRCVFVDLEAISNVDRVSEVELNRQFEEMLPGLLGGIYSLMADCLEVLPLIQTDNLPRMTDYARLGIAIEKVLNLPPGSFLAAYERNRQEQSENAFWSDDLCCAIHDKLEKTNPLSGTSHYLAKMIFGGKFGSNKPGAPRSAKAFSGWLKRIEPLLKGRGIAVERSRTADARLITIRNETIGPRPTPEDRRMSD